MCTHIYIYAYAYIYIYIYVFRICKPWTPTQQLTSRGHWIWAHESDFAGPSLPLNDSWDWGNLKFDSPGNT